MKYVALLNGPLGSGKDFIADKVIERIGGTKQQFKEELYRHTADLFGVTLTWLKSVATDRVQKEQANGSLMLDLEEFNKLNKLLERPEWDLKLFPATVAVSPRDALIYTSEIVYKPKHGKAYFGQCTARAMVEGVNYVADSGFYEEALTQVETFGAENVILFRIHRDGCEFDSRDSRNYIKLENDGVKCIDLDNNRDIAEVVREVVDTVYCYFGKEE